MLVRVLTIFGRLKFKHPKLEQVIDLVKVFIRNSITDQVDSNPKSKLGLAIINQFISRAVKKLRVIAKTIRFLSFIHLNFTMVRSKTSSKVKQHQYSLSHF